MSDAPKSAFEIAMERLRQKDAAAGVTAVTLTDEQRAAIAEVRNAAQAKLAHADVMHQSDRLRAADAESLAVMDDGYRRDRERIIADRESRIEKIRRGASSEG
jgi:hypothetical protein